MIKHTSKPIKLFFISWIFAFSAFSSPESITEEIFKWRKKELVVCIADTWEELQIPSIFFDTEKAKKKFKRNFKNYLKPYSNDLITEIKNTVTREYTIERTGIHFTGWDSCLNTINPDVVIATVSKKRSSSSSHTGRADKFWTSSPRLIDDTSDEHESSIVILNLSKDPGKFKTENRISLITLHELGHIAGLRHEHSRAEALKDINCQTSKTVHGESGFFSESTVAFGEYDSSSIMNYCFSRLVMDITSPNFLIRMPGVDIGIPSPDPDLVTLNYADINLKDSTIATFEKIDENFQKVHVNIGLSAGDVHTLRCMYLPDEEMNCKKAFLKPSQTPLPRP